MSHIKSLTRGIFSPHTIHHLTNLIDYQWTKLPKFVETNWCGHGVIFYALYECTRYSSFNKVICFFHNLLQPNIYGQTGDQTQASWIYIRCSTTELPSLRKSYVDCLSLPLD